MNPNSTNPYLSNIYFLSCHKIVKANVKPISSSSASWANELETI